MNLKREEFEHLAPEEYGAVERVNHNSDYCQGTSKSMRVVRQNDGSISAKCFRCGRAGFIGEKGKPSLFTTKHKQNKRRDDPMPTDRTVWWEDWPPEAKAYISKHHFDRTTAGSWGISWSPSMQRLIIPVGNRITLQAGWQAKSFHDNPRYLTFFHNSRYMFGHIGKHTKSLLIVEDMLSAIRGSELLSSFALLSSQATDTMISEMLRHQEFFVWLDNDNPTVKNQQLALFNRLNLYGKAYLIKSDVEVKDLTKDQVENVLRVAKQ